MAKIKNIQFIIILIMGFSIPGFSQHENNVWIVGSALGDNGNSEWLQDTTVGGTNIDFNYEPPRIHYDDDRIWDNGAANTSICDADGNLLFYSNGQMIYGSENEIIEDTINYGVNWELNYPIINGVAVPAGIPIPQSILSLPYPGEAHTYILIYSLVDFSISQTNLLRYTIVRFDDNNSNPIVLSKDEIIIDIPIQNTGVTACRHANGRDYWMIIENRDHTVGHTFLISPTGIEKIHEQELGYSYIGGIGWHRYSPNGDKYSTAMGHGQLVGGELAFIIYDFDRCTGLLSNFKIDTIPSIGSLGIGHAYSHDNTKVYVSNKNLLYQYDLEADDIIGSRKVAGVYDGIAYSYPPNLNQQFSTAFGPLATGPDGRIYISATSGNNRLMSTIERPYEGADNIDLRQKSVVLPTLYTRSVPNHMDLNLGPLVGSGCDTLGIVQVPLSRFRYDQDTSDYLDLAFTDLSYYNPLEWSWDFGDGTVSTDRFAKHTFAEAGVYNICLTVTNDFATDTHCKELFLGTVHTTDWSTYGLDVNVFPNPCTDYLNVDISNYLPKDGVMRILSFDGRVVKQEKVIAGKNMLDLRILQSGTYILEIYDDTARIMEMKIVKI